MRSARSDLPEGVRTGKVYFEVLGIRLDSEDMQEKVASVVKQKNMGWTQVYEGKGWEAGLATRYGVERIPTAFLVDGDTGVLLATGPTLRGGELAKTIEKALADRKPTTPK